MKIYMYDEEYAQSKNAKGASDKDPIKQFLQVLLKIMLGGIVAIFLSSIKPFVYISWLIMALWFLSWIGLSIRFARKISIYQDVHQTAFIYDEGIWWYIKLVYINEKQVFAGPPGNPIFTIAMSHNAKENMKNAKIMEERRQHANSYINAYMEAKTGNNFVKGGHQIIHNGPSGRAEVIRLDNLKVEELGKAKKSLCFTDYKKNNSKRIILNAFPELFEDIERFIKEGEIIEQDVQFPPNPENIKEQGKYVIPIIALAMIILSLALYLPDNIKTFVLDNRDYTYYVSDSMYDEATDGMDFVINKQYIDEEKDGRISVKLHGLNKEDDMNYVIWFKENSDKMDFFFTEMNSNANWLYIVLENEPE